MNQDDKSPRQIDPELEARVVAWVLGEASPFEVAELTRLVAADPELAVFKRRIEAVHGLVGEAARPLQVPMMLSPERRAKLLAVIGASQEIKSTPTEAAVVSSVVYDKAARNRWRSLQWQLPAAACLAFGLIVGGLIISRSESAADRRLAERKMAMDADVRASGVNRVKRTAATDKDDVVKLDAFEVSSPSVWQRAKTAAARAFSGEQKNEERPSAAPSAPLPVPATKAEVPMIHAILGDPQTVAPTMDQAKLFSESQSAQTNVSTGSFGGGGRGDRVGQMQGVVGGAALGRKAAGNPAPASFGDSNGNMAGRIQRDDLAKKPPGASPKVNDGALAVNKQLADSLTQPAGRRAALQSDAPGIRAEPSFDFARPPGGVTLNQVANGAYVSGGQAGKPPAIDLVAGEGRSLTTVNGGIAAAGAKVEAPFGGLTLSTLGATGSVSGVQAAGTKDLSTLSISGDLSGKSSASPVATAPGERDFSRFKGIAAPATNPPSIKEAGTLNLRTVAVAEGLTVAPAKPDSFLTESLSVGGAVTFGAAEFKGNSPTERLAGMVEDGKRAPSAVQPADRESNLEKEKADRPVSHALTPPSLDESLRAEVSAAVEPSSTFSLHVSDVSFRLARAALERGAHPDPATIRPEEFYNAFDYGDPAPVTGEPVACRIEQAAHPFLQQRNLVRIAMKVPATGRGASQPLRLTVLLDTSGSMEREDRAASARKAMEVLASLLGPDDRVTLIGFARQPHLLADRVPGDQASKLVDIVGHTPAEGGTNLEEALKLAADRARAQFTSLAQNRIVVLTDGAANLGNDDPAQLAAQVTILRQQGIAFDACGVGADGLDDSILEALTRKGDGRYYVINSPEEADAGFARQLAGAFRPAAQNVKLQVRFNPARVRAYRLIGFEQHRLREEDFRNDQVDAAELAAEEAAVALYQVEVLPEGEGELGEVSVRFRNAASSAMVERTWTLSYAPQAPAFDRATPSMQLAGTAASLAEKLRGGPLAAQIRLDEFAPVVNALRSHYANEARVQELVTMFAQARRVIGE